MAWCASQRATESAVTRHFRPFDARRCCLLRGSDALSVRCAGGLYCFPFSLCTARLPSTRQRVFRTRAYVRERSLPICTESGCPRPHFYDGCVRRICSFTASRASSTSVTFHLSPTFNFCPPPPETPATVSNLSDLKRGNARPFDGVTDTDQPSVRLQETIQEVCLVPVFIALCRSPPEGQRSRMVFLPTSGSFRFGAVGSHAVWTDMDNVCKGLDVPPWKLRCLL